MKEQTPEQKAKHINSLLAKIKASPTPENIQAFDDYVLKIHPKTNRAQYMEDVNKHRAKQVRA
jgi:hypothetical protein